MKRISLFFLLGILLLYGCAGKPSGSGDKLQVAAAAFPEYDFVRAVAGDLAEITLLLPPGAEAHSYEPTPQDIARIGSCRVFVYGGGESDVWLDRILDSGNREGKAILSLMDCCALREEEIQEHMTAEEEEGEETEYDEHVWTSPVNVIAITEAVRDALSAADPENAAAYAANAEDYIRRLRELDSALRELVRGSRRQLLVFGDRFPFLYFVREYGLSYAAAFPGCSSGTDANPATVAHLIDLVKAEEIPVVFRCDLSAGKIADTIAEAAGARVLTLWSGHTVSREAFRAGETYLTLWAKNLEALKEALY
ncbi:MAG: zinc ABC transporter substrate-binding protein [Oscillospiraceae bacterium]|nr:zinc ABC transporter substrate-binding protein [Oscillospiraceae bacterium]